MVIEVMRALGRRWYIVLLGLLLTCGMVYGAKQASPPEYHARGLVLLLPSESAVGKGGNPFLQLSGLEQPAGILAAYFSSAPARAEVEARSPNADYQVGIEDSTRGPVIAVDVTATSTHETLATLRYLLARIPDELARLQRQVDAASNADIGSMRLTVDQKPQSDRGGTLRLMIAAFVVGVVGTGVSAFAVDSLVERRRTRELRRNKRRERLGTTRRDARPGGDAARTETGNPDGADIANHEQAGTSRIEVGRGT